jgi:hypothetical protein
MSRKDDNKWSISKNLGRYSLGSFQNPVAAFLRRDSESHEKSQNIWETGADAKELSPENNVLTLTLHRAPA